MQKVKLIYNPLSGETMMGSSLDNIIAIYQKKGLQIVPYRLIFDSHCEESILFDLDDTYDHIIIAGGDGTVNFVINVLKSNNIDIPIALLPLGTANDFSLNIGMSRDLDRSYRKILLGEVIKSDLGIVNGHYFVNVLGFGLFSDLSLKTPTIFKNYFGKLAYYVGGLGEITKLKKINIKLTSDGGDYLGDCYLVLVFNGKTAGSLKIAHTADITDGKLDVLIVKAGTMEMVKNIFHYLSMTKKSSTSPYPNGMVHIQCSTMQIESSRNEVVDIDGEAGPEFPLNISCDKGAMRLIVPKTKPLVQKDPKQ